MGNDEAKDSTSALRAPILDFMSLFVERKELYSFIVFPENKIRKLVKQSSAVKNYQSQAIIPHLLQNNWIKTHVKMLN